jgi:hypothetical protein
MDRLVPYLLIFERITGAIVTLFLNLNLIPPARRNPISL